MTAEERRAVQKVQRSISALPRTVALYFHGDSATVMDCDPDGRIVGVSDGGYPREEAAVGHIHTDRCAAGDF